MGVKNWNYILFNFPDFVTGLKNTLWLVVAMVTLQIIFGLGVSLLITKIKRGGNVFRTLFYLPYLADALATEPELRVVGLRRPREETVESQVLED